MFFELRTLLWLIFWIIVIVWITKNPVQAGHDVGAIVNWILWAIGRFATFVGSI
jgi:hypothetical protein